MKTLVISAFPTMGKTTFFNKHRDTIDILDSDSSSFSWIKDDNGNNTKERNPNFIKDYIRYIKQAIDLDKYNIIFVSSHREVREALDENEIYHSVICPTASSKEEILKRMKDRDDSEEFQTFISDNFDNMVEEISEEALEDKFEFRVSTLILNKDEYITKNVIEEIKDDFLEYFL